MDKIINIAIDGPAGAGKSTIAKIIANKKGVTYLDTGAMYRAFALFALNSNIAADDLAGIKELLNKTDIFCEKDKMFLNNEDVTEAIRTPEVDQNVARYSKIKEVRDKMVKLQQDIAGKTSVIMDGRDITSVVLPNADYKFYLDASAEERARRRYLQNKEKGIKSDYDEILNDIIKRDDEDKNRKTSPLIVTEDSKYIDTSDMTQDDVVNYLLGEIC